MPLNPVNAGNVLRGLPGRFTEADFKECLEDIVAGRRSTGHKAVLQQGIMAYAKANLKKGTEIAPGCFKTGFSCVVAVPEQHSVRPAEWVSTDVDSAVKQLAEFSLTMINHPETVRPSDQITLANVQAGRPPPPGAPLYPPDQPIIGVDGFQNPVMLFHHSHPYVQSLAERVERTHSEGETLDDTDNWAWGRAGWAAILSHPDPEVLEQALNEYCDPALAAELIGMAKTMRAQGLSGITEEKTTDDADPASGGRVFKSSVADFEDQLKHATTRLLGSFSDDAGAPLTAPTDSETQTHVFTLMRAFGLPTVILGAEKIGENGETTREFSSSFPEAVSMGCKLGPDQMGGQEHVIDILCTQCPILVKNGSKYGVRLPISRRQTNTGAATNAAPPPMPTQAEGAKAEGSETENAGTPGTMPPQSDPAGPATPRASAPVPEPRSTGRAPSPATDAIRKAMLKAAEEAESTAAAARQAAAAAAAANEAAQQELRGRNAQSSEAASTAAATEAAFAKATAAASAASESAASAAAAANAPAA